MGSPDDIVTMATKSDCLFKTACTNRTREGNARARPFYCGAKSESEKSPRVVYGLNDKTVWFFFLKICPANNINSALNFASRVAN